MQSHQNGIQYGKTPQQWKTYKQKKFFLKKIEKKSNTNSFKHIF